MVPAELADLIDSGVAMLGASRSDDLVPEAFRVWGAFLADDGRLRVLASADTGRTAENLRTNGQIAVTFTDIHTFRSIQVKGVVEGGVEPPGPEDVGQLRRYHERFSTSLQDIGHPALLGERLRPFAIFCVWVRVDELFDQTPGRVAGTRLEGAGG